MKKAVLPFLLFLISGYSLWSQEKFTLSGSVTDNASNKTLIGLTILFPELNTGTVINKYGFYSITLPQGNYGLQVSFHQYLCMCCYNKITKTQAALLKHSQRL